MLKYLLEKLMFGRIWDIGTQPRVGAERQEGPQTSGKELRRYFVAVSLMTGFGFFTFL